jgi:hypothetical protein
LLFVTVVVLLLILWELSKINSHLKKSLVSRQDTGAATKTILKIEVKSPWSDVPSLCSIGRQAGSVNNRPEAGTS